MWSDVYLNDIGINSKYLEQVKSQKYLGSIVSGDNFIEEEITERIALGNKTYYANQQIFKRELVSKKAKLQLYWTVKAGACEYGNELLGSIKCGEFLDQLQNQLASQEGLCSME